MEGKIVELEMEGVKGRGGNPPSPTFIEIKK